MVAPASHPGSAPAAGAPAVPPPSFSPRDIALLNALIRSNFDLPRVAAEHGLVSAELFAWLTTPPIQDAAATLLRTSQTFLELRLTRARMAVIDTLESIALTHESPIERRRAACAIFRRPSDRPPAPRRDPADGPPPNPPSSRAASPPADPPAIPGPVVAPRQTHPPPDPEPTAHPRPEPHAATAPKPADTQDAIQSAGPRAPSPAAGLLPQVALITTFPLFMFGGPVHAPPAPDSS